MRLTREATLPSILNRRPLFGLFRVGSNWQSCHRSLRLRLLQASTRMERTDRSVCVHIVALSVHILGSSRAACLEGRHSTTL